MTAVEIDHRQMRYRLFAGNERIKVRGNAFYIRALEQGYLIDYRQEHPTATKEELVRKLAEYHQLLRDKGLSDQIYTGGYKIIAGGLQALADAGFNPGSSFAASALKSLLDPTLGAYFSDLASIEDQITGSWQTYDAMRKLKEQIDYLHERVARIADSDRAFGDARDAFFGDLSGFSVYASDDQFLRDPILATWINSDTIISMLQQHIYNDSDLIALVREQFKNLANRLDAERQARLDATIREAGRYPVSEVGERGTVSVYSAALDEANRAEIVLNAGLSAIRLISALASPADSKLAKDIEIFGTGMIQVMSAVNAYRPTVAGLGLGQALGSLSTVALTGNILGAVMTLLPLFMGSKDPDEAILDELEKLRDDVRRLRDNMGTRFDRIERGLNTVYGDMLYNFDRIIELQTGMGAQIGEIGHALVSLQSKLDELGMRLTEVLEAIQQRELKEQINYALGYRERYHTALPHSDFLHAENQFQFYATNVSLDASSTAPVEQPSHVRNVEIDPALAGQELHRNLGYLTWLASQRFGQPIQPRRLPNPVVWSLAARSYARLIGENTGYASTLTRQPQIRATGAELDQLVREISRPQSGTTNLLFTRLASNYREAVQGLSSALRAEHERVLAGRRVNLFDDVGQAQPALPQQLMMGSVEESGPYVLSTPSNMQPNNLLPASIYTALAAYRVERDNPELTTGFKLDFHETRVVRGQFITNRYATAGITVQARFRFNQNSEWLILKSVSKETFNGVWFSEDRRTPDDRYYAPWVDDIEAQWESSIRPAIEALTPTLNVVNVENVTARTAEYLRAEARRYLTTVSQQLGQPSDLRNAVLDMTGAATLLRAYSQIGFPKALDTDDLFSAMVTGYRSIVCESASAPMISTTFTVANSRFDAPVDHLYDVLWDQPYLSRGVPTPATITLPGEPVGDALISSASARMNLLEERLAVHSRRLSDGQYLEALALVDEVDARLSLAESLIRQ